MSPPSDSSSEPAPSEGHDREVRSESAWQGLAKELAEVRGSLDDIENSTAWRLVSALRGRKEWVIPLGSKREAAWISVTHRLVRGVHRLLPPALPERLARLAASERRPRAVWLSGPGGASRRYRCEHALEALEGIGGAGVVFPWTHPVVAQAPAAVAAACEALVLHRVPWRPEVAALVEACRAKGVRVIYDADDLVFDPGTVLPLGVQALLAPAFQAEQLATLRECDAATFSTRPLVERAATLGARAPRLLRNAYSVGLSAASDGCTRRHRDGRVVLGYASGSATHDADLAVAAPALASLLREQPQVELRLIGPVVPPPELADLPGLRRLPAVPWRSLPMLLADLDLNLAPLDASNAFVRSKSAVKWIESALVGVPTLASSTPAFQEAIGADERGALAETSADWTRQLAALVDDSELRRRLGERARAHALREYGCALRGEVLRAVLQGAAH